MMSTLLRKNSAAQEEFTFSALLAKVAEVCNSAVKCRGPFNRVGVVCTWNMFYAMVTKVGRDNSGS